MTLQQFSSTPISPQAHDISLLKKAQAAVAAHYGSDVSVAVVAESFPISSKDKSKCIEVDIVPQETVKLVMTAGGEATPLLTFNIASHEEIHDSRLTDYAIMKEEFFQLVKLAIPLILSALLEMLPEMLLGMLVGHSSVANSAKNLAAYNLANMFQGISTASLTTGISAAIDTLCAQAFGGGKLVEMWIFCQTGLIMYTACLPIIFAVLLNAKTILIMLGQDPQIAAVAGIYIAVVSVSIPISILSSLLKNGLQSQNIVYPFAICGVSGLIITLLVAYLVAFHTSLGYLGCALAVPASAFVKLLVLIPVYMNNRVFREHWPGWQLKKAVESIPKVAKLAVSSGLMVVFQLFGFVAISLLAGMLPNAQVAISTNGIFTSLQGLALMPLLGLSAAGGIRVGNALGANDSRRASIMARLLMCSSFCVSVIGALVILFARDVFAHGYTTDPITLRAASYLIAHVWPLILLVGLSSGLFGIFQACGKQLLCAKYNFACLLMIGIPMGLLLARHFDYGLIGLWYGNLIGLSIYAVTGFVWISKLDWDEMARNATRFTHVNFDRPAEAF